MIMKGQGSLEYLIILAVILGVAAIVIFFVTGATGAAIEQGTMNKCREATAQCASLLFGGSYDCTFCEEACIDTGGYDIISGTEGSGTACELCKAGETNELINSEIEEPRIDDPECNVDSDCEEGYECTSGNCVIIDTSICGDGIRQGSEQCDGDLDLETRQDRCDKHGYESGSLACTDKCRYDFSACHNN